MRILSWPRGAGKTTEMVRWVREDPTNRVLLVATEMEARRLRDTFQISAVSPSSSRNLRGRRGRIEVAVDNLDWVMENLIGHPVSIATVTKGA